MTDETVTSRIGRFVSGLQETNTGVEIAVILIGSVARGTATAQSDLDLLVLSENRLSKAASPDGLHVQCFTVTQFTERLKTGDDFAAWCVRYGVPVVDATLWTNLLSSSDAKTWPSWPAKIGHTLRRLLLAVDLRKGGDFDAAREELVYAVTHIARAILIKAGVFPLSRPEMINQLKEAAHPALARLLDGLLYHEPTMRDFDRAARYVKKLAVALDRDQYQDYVRSRKAKRAAKKRLA